MTRKNPTDWRKNVKRVIRIALVGIEASDQVLIKGYMRVLLRVEFDLEWVAPRHPQVDLLIVHNKFSNAESVQKLLSENQILTALYIEKTPDKKNTIENNVLYLSLEHLSPLENWLKANVEAMKTPLGTQTTEQNKVNLDFEQSDGEIYQQLEDQAETQALEAGSNLPYSDTQTKTKVDATHEQTKPSDSLADEDTQADNKILEDEGIDEGEVRSETITLFNALHNRSDDHYYFNISSHGKIIATIHPKTRRVWPQGNTFYPAFSFAWSVTDKLNTRGLTLSEERAMNLHNWLWRCAHRPGSAVEGVLPDNTRISITFWPKPANDSDKSTFLRMLALAEVRPVNVDDITANIKADRVIARRFLGALYMCGMAQTNSLPTADAFLKMQLSDRLMHQDKTQEINSDVVEAYLEEQDAKIGAAELREHSAIVQDKRLGGVLGRIRSALGI